MFKGVNSPGISNREAELDIANPIPHKNIMEMFYRLELAVSNTFEPKSGNWNYIPFSHGCFYYEIQKHVNRETKYLEVGCGIGTKLHIVHNILGVQDVTGLEISPELARIARAWFGYFPKEDGFSKQYWAESVKILDGDAMEFAEYGNYDVIYAYAPQRNSYPLYNRIIEQMKPGAKLLRAYFSSDKLNVYQK